MSESQKREQSIFEGALELPAAQRGAYLERATGGDSQIRERVESLLKGHEEGGFLDRGAVPDLRRSFLVSVPVQEKPGDRIGRYKLLEQIGEGGCGVVYTAQQEEPVRRRVALKIIK